MTSDIHQVSDEELIRRLHLLFYRAIHLEHAVQPLASQMELRQVRERDEDSLMSAIHQGLAELSYRAFAILPFNLEKRCFAPKISTITSLDVVNLLVDIYDSMYTEIVEEGKGIIITPDSIREDVFLRKRFGSHAGQGDDHFYINSLWNLYRPLVDDLFDPESPDPGFRMSPLLIIRLKPPEAATGADAVDRRIAERLALFFLLYSAEERQRIGGSGGDMPAQSFRCLEYLFMAFKRMRGAVCFILTFREFHTSKGRFLFSYLESVLRSILSGASSVQQIDKNRLAVFASADDAERVRKTIARWNDVHDNLGITGFDSGTGLNFNEFLNNYIFQ